MAEILGVEIADLAGSKTAVSTPSSFHSQQFLLRVERRCGTRGAEVIGGVL
jgi:hypothetical protein